MTESPNKLSVEDIESFIKTCELITRDTSDKPMKGMIMAQQLLDAMRENEELKDKALVSKDTNELNRLCYERLEQENERLREVLVFYGKEENHKFRSRPYWSNHTAPATLEYPLGYPNSVILDDNGKLAREALQSNKDSVSERTLAEAEADAYEEQAQYEQHEIGSNY